MVAPRSRNPLFNRVPNYQRPVSGYNPNLQPPLGVDPNNPAWMASRREAARMNVGNNPMSAERRPAAGGIPGAGYNPNLQPPPGVDPNNPAWMSSRREAARMNTDVPGAGYDQVAAAAAVLGRMAENPISGTTPPKPPSPQGLISPGNPMTPPVSQLPDVNMNFTGGMGAGMATRIAGLMPGLTGMVSQGMLAGVGNGLAASKRSPLSFIPPGGMQPALPGDVAATNRLNMIEGMPRITSSSQAGMVAGSNPMSSANAALTNGYSPLPSITEGQAYAQGLPMDRAGQSRRIENQNPMFSGMQGRFGAGGALSPSGEYAQSGGTGWYDRLSTQEKYGYGPTTPGVDGRISSDPRYATGMLPKDKDRPARGTPEDRTYLARKYDEQERRQQDFRDQNGGMSSRQVRRQEQKDRSEAFRFRKAVEGGLNPMSSKAQAMFPNAAAVAGKVSSKDNPMNNNNSISNAVEAAGRAAEREVTSPTLVGMGYEPGSGVGGLHSALTGYVTENPDATLSDSDIKDMQDQLNDHVASVGETTAFDPSNFSSLAGVSTQGATIGKFYADLWRELQVAGDDPKKRAQWAESFRNRQARLDALMAEQFPTSGG